ncbi:hypothetical protein I8752_22210, partial [Nostocaceae cyanobacterium CENA369]
MLEEEMGISLKVHESPFKQALAAALGAFLTGFICLLALLYFSKGFQLTGFSIIFLSTLLTTIYEKTRKIPAIVWSVGLALLGYGFIYYLLQALK